MRRCQIVKSGRSLRARAGLLARALAVPLTAAVVVVASAASADVVDWATPVGRLPATVGGTTEDAQKVSEAPVPSCSPSTGVVWYSTRAPRRGPMLATVSAVGETDASLVVYRLVRSKRVELVCKLTDDRYGKASVPWYARPGESYLLGVGRATTSPPGRFRLSVVSREPSPMPPGDPLPTGGVSATVAPLVDTADAWALPMKRGTSYKIGLATRRDCVQLDVYRPGGYSFVDAVPVPRGSLECGGYMLFTPGIDGGGTYSLVVRATGSEPGPQGYRLMAEAAGPDDTAPGTALTNGEPVTDGLAVDGLDVVDLYSFTVPRENSLTTIDLRPGPKLKYDLLVLDETGGRVRGVDPVRAVRGKQFLEEEIPSGRYFLALRAVERTAGVYRLTVLTREVTTTTMYANGQEFVETTPDRSVPLQVSVTGASHGGVVNVEIDRFDPISGWQFSTVVSGEVDSGGRLYENWTPPWPGHWRALARYAGNVYSTPSKSDYVRVHVAAALEQ